MFDKEIVIGEIKADISFSFGVVKYPTQGKTVDELIKNASVVMEDSKFKNKNTFVFFEENNFAHNLDNQELDLFVSKLDLELFEVYLMPIVNTKTNIIGGFECLTRVLDDKGKYMHTETIINSLERNGRIQELDEIVFLKMLAIMKRINKEFDHEIFLSLNASALSMNELYVNKIIRSFKQAKLTRGVVVLELTESEKVDDQDLLIGLFKKLNAAGIKIGIDDFGTGYSSLSYISKFPIYAIKIDKEFVRDFKENDFNVTLVKTLNSIATSLGCKLVAEGVELQETLDFLIDYNCPFYQGYLFSKGVPLGDAITLLKENSKLIDIE